MFARWSWFVVWLLLCSACSRERLAPALWEQVPLPVSDDLSAVWFADSLFGAVTGGVPWERGFVLITRDGGQSWSIDTATLRKTEWVQIGQNGNVYVVGQDAGIVLEPHLPYWQPFWVPYRWSRACHYPDPLHGAVVVGSSYRGGQVYVTGPDAFWQKDTLHEMDHELNAVWFSDAQTAHAVGFGWVGRSTDAGHTWTRLPISGDHFLSVHFPDTQTGYICGATGTLLKTTDGGKEWKEIRKGGALGRRHKGFRSVWFEDAERGWLAGDNGLLWYTTNGGTDWQSIENTPETVDFSRVQVRGGQGWVCGNNGHLYRFKL